MGWIRFDTYPSRLDVPHNIAMNSRRRFLFQIAIGISLLVMGYLVGRFHASKENASLAVAVGEAMRGTASSGSAVAESIAGSSAISGGDWAARWARLSAQPHSPAADKASEDALEKLGESDPARALAIAMQERNRGRRADWMHAVLRGWAAVAPDAAAAWIGTLPAIEREGAEGAVMDGAARNPAAAVALAQRLVLNDPVGARSHANQLLRVLGNVGSYEASIDFAARLPEEIRSEMFGTAFQYWAQAQPERALDVAMKLPPGESRKTALDAAVSGWSQGDPAGLAEFALKFSSTEDRTEALQTALREWVQINPKAASEWIDKFDSKPELDAGAAAVALQPDVLAKNPEIAASWAESITGAELRLNTLTNVLREWAGKDAAAAMNYARTSTALQPAEREALLAELARASAP